MQIIKLYFVVVAYLQDPSEIENILNCCDKYVIEVKFRTLFFFYFSNLPPILYFLLLSDISRAIKKMEKSMRPQKFSVLNFIFSYIDIHNWFGVFLVTKLNSFRIQFYSKKYSKLRFKTV